VQKTTRQKQFQITQCSSFPAPYYLPHSDKRVKNAIENTVHLFCMKKKWFSKLLLNRLHFAKNLTWVMVLVSIAFQWYIASLIWTMLREVQPLTTGSSGRTTQVVKLQQTQLKPKSKILKITKKNIERGVVPPSNVETWKFNHWYNEVQTSTT
jgi:hypothetical protein